MTKTALTILTIGLLAAALTIGVLVWALTQKPSAQPQEVVEGEIDTSGWLTYRNEEYGFEFKYPSDVITETNGNIFKFYPDNYDVDESNGYYIEHGYVLSAIIESVPNGANWESWVQRPRGPLIGEGIINKKTLQNDTLYIEIVQQGFGVLNNWPEEIIKIWLYIPHGNGDELITFSFSSHNDNNIAQRIFSIVIKSFSWL